VTAGDWPCFRQIDNNGCHSGSDGHGSQEAPKSRSDPYSHVAGSLDLPRGCWRPLARDIEDLLIRGHVQRSAVTRIGQVVKLLPLAARAVCATTRSGRWSAAPRGQTAAELSLRHRDHTLSDPKNAPRRASPVTCRFRFGTRSNALSSSYRRQRRCRRPTTTAPGGRPPSSICKVCAIAKQ